MTPRTYYRKSFTVAAYTFRAANHCPACIHRVLPTGPDEPFDGWAHAEGVEPRSDEAVETALTELAVAFGIDRFDEATYDSDDFPKVVFVDQLEPDETCDTCGEEL